MSKASTTNLPFSRKVLPRDRTVIKGGGMRVTVIDRPFADEKNNPEDQLLSSVQKYAKSIEKDPFKACYGLKKAQKEAKRVDSLLRERIKNVAKSDVDKTTAKKFVDFLTSQLPDANLFSAAVTTTSSDLLGQWTVLEPPFSPSALAKLPVQNNTLGQCIEAMRTNVEMFGYTLEYIGKPEEKESPAVKDEFAWVNDLLVQPNAEDDLTGIREKLRVDYETLGWGALEVGRDEKGDVTFIYHVEANTLRMTRHERDAVETEVQIRRGGDKYVTAKVNKRYRRYVQIVGGQRVYFKEFGDPRKIDPETGIEDPTLSLDDAATEIIWFSRYVTGEFYGLPRWINQLPSILGSREAELTNLAFFQDNAIPALAVLVSGGLLTEESLQKIKEQFETRGRAAVNRVLVLEARAVEDQTLLEGMGAAVPKLDLKPLAADRQQDSLFGEYGKSCQTIIRSSFRLPPLILGLSEDYSRATAESSLETADSQVFSPERGRFDKIVNNKVLLRNGIPPQFWKFRSNPAKVVSIDGMVQSVKALDTMGAMTPNLAIQMANELFDMQIPKIEQDWGNAPYDFVKQLIIKGMLIPESAASAGKVLEPPPTAANKPGAPAKNPNK